MCTALLFVEPYHQVSPLKAFTGLLSRVDSYGDFIWRVSARDCPKLSLLRKLKTQLCLTLTCLCFTIGLILFQAHIKLVILWGSSMGNLTEKFFRCRRMLDTWSLMVSLKTTATLFSLSCKYWLFIEYILESYLRQNSFCTRGYICALLHTKYVAVDH